MLGNFYETDQALSEYLLFHYGTEPLPRALNTTGALDFPVRCVAACLDRARLPAAARALDLGCAVGRATFELARYCAHVIGIDYSQHFVAVADHLKNNGSFAFTAIDEGELTVLQQAVVPPEIERTRVRFERGDAMNLPNELGSFDVVLMANLIDRLADPRRCLAQLPRLVRGGGQLILTSPYTWMSTHTARENWLGGFLRAGEPVRTLDTLKEILLPTFELVASQDLPFLIREHSRKFQFGLAGATVWRRR